MSDYGRRLVVDADFDLTLARTVDAIQDEGLDIISRFDLKDHLQHLLRHDCRRYVLLQVASPDLLLRALQTNIDSGPALPVTIAVYELADGESAVEATEPFAPVVSDLAWRRRWPELAAVADRESQQVARALARIARPATSEPLAPGIGSASR
jgi:uncharacterized protein (DUF302 family)